jgi:hypothetical protein
MRLSVKINKCQYRECTKGVSMVRRLGHATFISYEGFCAKDIKHAPLYDDRDCILTLEQAQLEIIKARL